MEGCYLCGFLLRLCSGGSGLFGSEFGTDGAAGTSAVCILRAPKSNLRLLGIYNPGAKEFQLFRSRNEVLEQRRTSLAYSPGWQGG